MSSFIDSSDVQYLYQCTKVELKELADKYEVDLISRLKEDMQKKLVRTFVNLGVLGEEQEESVRKREFGKKMPRGTEE